jgi:hypothetical protein
MGSDNLISKNNFIDNQGDVQLRYPAIWNNIIIDNYWDKWIGLKLPMLNFLPYFKFYFLGIIIDWYPASEPYNFTGV